MYHTEKPLITIAMFKNWPFFRVVNGPAQPEAAVSCRACGTTLTAEASKAAGIGPVCAKKEKVREKKPKTSRKVGAAEPRQVEVDTEGPAAKRKPDSWQYFLERNADALRGR